MAFLPVEDIWDEFETSKVDFDFDNTMDETFTDLEDFAETPDHESFRRKIADNPCTKEEIFDISDLNSSPVEPDAYCMWSSHPVDTDILSQQISSKSDFGLTLSENNEGTLTVERLSFLGDASLTYIETPLTTSPSNSQLTFNDEGNDDDDDDDKDDVVSSDNKHSSTKKVYR
jgi:hypothetical protein